MGGPQGYACCFPTYHVALPSPCYLDTQRHHALQSLLACSTSLLPYTFVALQEQEVNGGTSKLRTLSSKDLLVQLPMLQHLLQRLVDCKPSGQATHDPVVQVGRCLVSVPLLWFLGVGPDQAD